jgi:hypothetical protein
MAAPPAPGAVRRAALPGGQSLEWVEWPDDPRHELVFENAHTRIYRAAFKAGEACETLFHRHKEVCGRAPRRRRRRQAAAPAAAGAPLRARRGSSGEKAIEGGRV